VNGKKRVVSVGDKSLAHEETSRGPGRDLAMREKRGVSFFLQLGYFLLDP